MTDRPRSGPVVGIDLGATKVVSIVFDDGQGVVARTDHRLYPGEARAAVMRAVLESTLEAVDATSRRPVRVGVGVAAQVDSRRGVVLHSPNLGWRDVPLSRWLERHLGIPTVLINDARAATLAEWKLGAGRGCSDLVCLMIGTGIGASAVVGGSLWSGAWNAAGEVGHLTVVSGGRRCTCPNRGCLEAYAGGWAIAARAREEVRKSPRAGRWLLRSAGSIRAITARTVFDGYRANDPLSRAIVRSTETYLADGAVSVANAFNPARLIIGGGIAEGLPHLIGLLRQAVKTRCQPPAARAKVCASELGRDTVAIGAALAAQEALR